MRTFEKSHKLDYVCYDIRGPVMDEAQRMAAQGMEILKLNIGNCHSELPPFLCSIDQNDCNFQQYF